jgi:hypothetical protein
MEGILVYYEKYKNDIIIGVMLSVCVACIVILYIYRPVPCKSGTRGPNGKSPWLGSCQKCDENSFSYDNTPYCFSCQYGSFLKSGDAGPCYPCPEGHYLKDDKCKKCPAGTYANLENGVRLSCTECPLGTYNENAGSEKCTPCPDGKTTTTVRTIHKKSCVSVS